MTLTDPAPEYRRWLSLIPPEPPEDAPTYFSGLRRGEKLSHYALLSAKQASEMGLVDGIRVEEIQVPVDESGGHQVTIKAKVYSPASETCLGPFPMIIHIHGGEWSWSAPAIDELYCRQLCKHTKSVVVDLDYRNGEKGRYPVPFDDLWEATKWLLSNGIRLCCHPQERGFILSGNSSGASMALALAHMAIETGFQPEVTGIILRAPWVCHPSAATKAKVRFPSFSDAGSCAGSLPTSPADQASNAAYYSNQTSPIHGLVEINEGRSEPPDSERRRSLSSPTCYHEAQSVKDPSGLHTFESVTEAWTQNYRVPEPFVDSCFVSPIFLKKHGLPRIYIQLCSLDVSFSEGCALVGVLQDRGCEVRVHVFEGMPHSFWNLPRMEGTVEAFRKVARAVTWLEEKKGGWDSGIREETIDGEEAEGPDAWCKYKLCFKDCGCLM